MPARIQQPKPLTEEEKRTQILRFISQKRETFSIAILQGLCSNMGHAATNTMAKANVALAVEMADMLMEKLYPIPEEEPVKE